MLKNWINGLADLVYPVNCLICRTYLGSKRYNSICEKCLNKLDKNLPPFCAKCGGNLKENEQSQGICLTCQKRNYHFKRAWSPTLYQDTMEDLIHMFKYRNKPQLAKPLSQIMIDFINNYNLHLKGFDMLVAVPLHPSRLREREYNQAQLLAQNISQSLSIPLSEGNLERLKPTSPQSNLSAQKRWDNVANAFRLKYPRDFKDQRILLIDDLLTTGATCSEVARILNEASVNSVYVLTLAIAQ